MAKARGIMHDKVAIFSRSFIYCITLFFVCILCGLKHPLEAWTPLPGIAISSQFSANPQIGMDAAGNATAIWLEDNTNTGLSTIQVATLPRGASVWSAPVSISSPVAGFITSLMPQIAVTPSGYSIAVWVQTINGTSAVVQSATRSVFGGSWSSPLTISAPTTDINNLNPQVAVDPNGNAVAVWAWFNGTNHVIQAATLPFNASFWTNLINLSDPTKNSLYPQIALDAAGNGVAVWNQTTDKLIQSRTFSGGTWLATTYTLSSPASAFFVLPQLAMNPSGVAVAVWVSNTNAVVNASRFIGRTWSAPVNISTPGLPGGSGRPSIAVDIFGNALAMWSKGGASPLEQFIESAYLPIGSSMWSIPIVATPIIVDTFFGNQRAAFDAQGNATAVWGVADISAHDFIQAAMLPFGTNLWENLTTLSSTNLTVEPSPQIAVDPSGYAVAVWVALHPTVDDNVVYATTNPAPPLPPSSFIGVVKKNKFLNKTECLLQAIWTSSISNVSSYLIYKNGVLVSTILATDPFIFRTCLRHCSTEGYEISAVGLDGLVSNPIALEVIHEKPCR